MGKIPAKKVLTPGSGRVSSGSKSPAGRPKLVKKKELKGAARKNNYRCRYSQEAMKAAVKAVKEKKMGVRQAAKEYSVPKSTLSDLACGATKTALGRPTVLSDEEELLIVQRLKLVATWGYPLSRHDLCFLIQEYLNTLGRATRFIPVPVPTTITIITH